MKIKVTKEIERCVDCPFFAEGNGKDSDFCSHPSSRMRGYAILESESNAGFSPKCPLLKGNILKEYNKQKNLGKKLSKLWK